jgi:hypothetical protein
MSSSRDIRLTAGKVESVPVDCVLPMCEPEQMFLYSDTLMESALSSHICGFAGVANSDIKSVLMVSPEGNTLVRKG